MNRKPWPILTIFILLLAVLFVNSSTFFRLKLAKLYESVYDNDRAAKVYEKIYIKNSVLKNKFFDFYKLTPEQKYEMSKKIAEYYFKINNKNKAMEHYNALKELKPSEYKDYLKLYILNQNIKELVRIMLDSKGTKDSSLKMALPSGFIKTPFWKYSLGLALLKRQEWQGAKEIFGQLVFEYPYLSTFKMCLENAQQEKVLADYPVFDIAGIWKLDEGNGAEAMDSSGRGNHGKIYGARYVKGINSNALEFDDAADKVIIPYDPSLQVFDGNFTIAIWIKPKSWKGFCFVYHKHRPNFFISKDEKTWGFEAQEGERSNSVAISYPVEDKWYFAVQRIKQNKEHKLWLFDQKGLIKTQTQHHITVTRNTHDAFQLSRKGWAVDDENFKGTIDEFMIFSRDLSDDEIQQLYQFNVEP